jgi:hypothetical protein
MKHVMLVSVLVGSVLVGCVPQSTFVPVHATRPSSNAFGVAVRVLVDHGEAIETNDEAAGVVVTKWSEHTDALSRVVHTRWRISITDEVVVDSQCQIRDPNAVDSDWADCQTQPDERGAKARAIAAEIASAPKG